MFSHPMTGLFFEWSGIIALFVNAASYIPQILKLIERKASDEISLVMFSVFFLTLCLMILYGFYKHDYILISGYALSVVACGTVIALVLYYRYRPGNKN